MTTRVSPRFALEHRATVTAMLMGATRSMLPFVPTYRSNITFARRMVSPSVNLVTAYNRWLGVGISAELLPPSLVVAQSAMAVVSRLTSYCPYPLLGVLNQGVHLVVNKPLTTGEPLQLQGELIDASDDGYRARIHTRVTIGSASQPDALYLDAFAAVVLKARPSTPKEPNREPNWQTIGQWQAAANEGQKFALLTGDFNPLHTLPLIAKRTRFKGCIMHGYGAFAQVYAGIENSGRAIKEIETRFIKPLPLPSPELNIQIAPTEADGRTPYRLVDASGNLYQVGHFCAELKQ